MRNAMWIFMLVLGVANAGTVTPEDFGATGSGDDSVAFQKALDSGQTVNCPAGHNYLITRQLHPPSGSNIVGGCTVTTQLSAASKSLFYTNTSLTIDGMNFRGKRDLYLVNAAGAAGITIQNTHVTGGGIANITDLNGSPSSGIVVVNNIAVGPGAYGTFQAIQIVMSSDFRIQGNDISSYGHGIQWWGGNSGEVDGVAAVGKPRNVAHGTITGNHVYKVAGGAIWGSMGDDISVTTNTVSEFGDVGIDNEGGTNITVSGNTITNNACTVPGGGIAAFFLVSNYVVTGNNVIAQKGCPAFAVHNDPSHLSPGPLVISSNSFSETDGFFSNMIFEQIGELSVKDNHLVNTTFVLGSYGYGNVTVEHNTLNFSIDAGLAAVKLVDPIGTVGSITARSNTITTTKSDTTTLGLFLGLTDAGSPSVAYVIGNTINGFPVSIYAKGNSPTSGVAVSYNLQGNYLSGEIQTIINHPGGGPMQVYVSDNLALDGTPWNPAGWPNTMNDTHFAVSSKIRSRTDPLASWICTSNNFLATWSLVVDSPVAQNSLAFATRAGQ